MKGFIGEQRKYNSLINEVNCDVWYGYDREISEDSIGYYQNLIEKGIFFKRPILNVSKLELTDEERSQLMIIREIFNKHGTKYKIIISPIYDQVPMEKEQVELLKEVFNEDNVFNFSGKNQYTESIFNYYEVSHYRPHVAREIMKTIYEKPTAK